MRLTQTTQLLGNTGHPFVDIGAATLARLHLQDGQPVAEDQVGNWPDETYTGTIRENWLRRYADAQAGFTRQFAQPLRLFNGDDHLAQIAKAHRVQRWR